MVDKTLSYLDFTKIIGILKTYSATHFADAHIESLGPLSDLNAIHEKQDRIEAVLNVVKWDGRIPISDIPVTGPVFKKIAIRDAVLNEDEFIAVAGFLKACADIRVFLKKAFHKAAYVDEAVDSLNPLNDMYSRILKTVNAEGFIEDTASYELSKIRAGLFGLREKIKRQLERAMEKESVRPVLQDSYIAIRNGRYVIPMKPNFNEALQGIVHDYSHSLKTSFVEPVECIEANNAINILEEEENEEEKNILKELTLHVKASIDDLRKNLDVISELDSYHCIALFSQDFDCVRPDLQLNGPMEIKEAFNPFIVLSKKEKAVPIDLLMANEKKAMIISGPNAGGKTAALKTIGLLTVMAHSGLLVPATGRPRVPFVSHVFAIIGDEQDISMELSSFTAHMQTIKDVYERSYGNELILIDEIGGGTDPQEASALSMSILDGFVEKGCCVIVTTHLNLLKAYGYTKSFAINAATEFDAVGMKPLYKLQYGMAGYSNAISVARNLNLPPDIIERSYRYMGEQEHMLNDLVNALEEGSKKVKEERENLVRLKNESRKRLSLLKEKKEEYLRKTAEKCDAILRTVEAEIEEIRKEVAKKERSSIVSAKERLKIVRKKSIKKDLPGEASEVSLGDYVLVRSLGSKGHIVGIDKPGEMYEVQIGNLRARIIKEDLVKAGSEGKMVGLRSGGIHAIDPLKEVELNVIGMHVVDALEEVDRFIDRAIVQNATRVRIIHGVGKGRLMTAIKEHLHEVGFIKSINRDEKNAGITLVDLA